MNFRVTKQGGIILNEGCTIIAECTSVKAVCIDMKSKRGMIAGYGNGEYPSLYLIGIEGSLKLKNGFENVETIIEFPDLKGWNIFSANVSRYTVSICFLKK